MRGALLRTGMFNSLERIPKSFTHLQAGKTRREKDKKRKNKNKKNKNNNKENNKEKNKEKIKKKREKRTKLLRSRFCWMLFSWGLSLSFEVLGVQVVFNRA